MSFATNQNLSSFLQRHKSLFEQGNLVVAGQLQGINLDFLQQEPSNTIFTTDTTVYNQLQMMNDAGAKIVFNYQDENNNQLYDAALIFVSKAKQETLFWIKALIPLLSSVATIYLVGENKGGINSTPNLLNPFTNNVIKYDSARHCTMYAAQLDEKSNTGQFNLDSCYTNYPIQILNSDNKLNIFALPGVFSASELDEGTSLLLDSLPPLHGSVLDMGCGAGVIGTYLKTQYPDIILSMADVSLLAVRSAEKTIQENHLEAKIFASDMFSHVTGKFDFIISNPPFHAGLKTHYSATEAFLRDASQYLYPNGQLYIVANKFLRYEPILEEKFKHVSLVNQNQRFKIIRAK